MKALTIKQPWADLIIAGVKDIENRRWKTSYRGRVLIHTSKSPCSRGDLDAYPLSALSENINLDKYAPGRFTNGAIIGSVDIVDCVMNHPSEWAEKGVYNWVLANPKKYDSPICNVKGMLGLWDYKGNINN
ncbi:MAG: ASCH domain-containing protein [Muribaculaceae bacterium]|nr:ASCH domain-containing protein [Muribaculaceae bacterium]